MSGPAPDPERPLALFAPGSLLPVQAAIRSGFAAATGAEVVFAPPAYSGVLAARILAGAAADVFVSADPVSMAPLVAAGLVPRPRDLAGNRLAVVARRALDLGPGDSGGTIGLAALAADGVRLLLPPAATDPLGRYAAEAFARAGLTDAIARKRARGEVCDDLPTLAAGLRDGTVDTAVVYATSAPQFAHADVRPLPPALDLHDRIRFVVGTVRRPGAPPHPAADSLVGWLSAPAGRAVLRNAGFVVS